MKIFLDTEFYEDGRTIDLISIALVAEDGREYYACNKEFDLKRMTQEGNGWLWKHVMPHIPPFKSDKLWRTRAQIRQDVHNFCSQLDYGKPEFWAYYADYDWIVFCQLFGRMGNLPKSFPMYCNDLKQYINLFETYTLPKSPDNAHDALADARWNKAAYEWLQNLATYKQITEGAS